MTTEELSGLGDPVIRRLQQAFAHEEPAVELATVVERADRYRAGQPPDAVDAPVPRRGLTAADLSAARRREPAAVTRVYTAYAPALFRFFMAAVSDRHLAEDLTGTAFVSAIEALPRFRGPVEALGGWLFQIARHDLYDHRRKQARSRIEAPEERLDEHAALRRLSPREREILGLIAGGWSSRRIAEDLLLSLDTVRGHTGSMLAKLGVETKLEAVALALEHGWSPAGQDPGERAAERLERTLVPALAELSPDQREVLLLRLSGGLTASEVAAVLGKTTGAVRALQHRGLASLARLLVSRDEDPSSGGSGSPPSVWGDEEGTAWEPRPGRPGP
jgi:RNA polymerase sigma factor (sigma-70 family)